MTVSKAVFGIWDYIVVILVLVISSSIGMYYRFTGGKQKTMNEYLLADKNMSFVPVAFSLMASFMSAITLLGVSSENYTYGFQFIIINISYGIFTPVAVYLYLPVFFKLQATSAYEYLEQRFGKVCRLAASVAYTLQMTMYMGVVLYAPALALEALTGINQVTAILSIGAVCTFYSTLGGMKAVLMTDVFQSLLMFAAVFSVIICESVSKGGPIEIFRIATRGNRTGLLNFDPDPTVRHSWFTLIIGGGITFLTVHASNQTQIQRYLTVKDLKTAQKALWLNWPILSLLSLSTSFAGLAIYAKYYDCDPYDAKYINSFDQLMPYYVIDTMGHLPGLSGLFVAGIFSASLSTVSAALNSLAAITLEDYYKPLHQMIFKTQLSEKKAGIHTKLISFFFGIVCIAVAFLAQFLGSVLQTSLTIFGVIGGPLLGLFSLGMFTTVANEEGAVTGLVFGVAFALWMAFGEKPPPETLPRTTEGCTGGYLNQTTTNTTNNQKEYFWLYRVSYLYNGVFGLLLTFVVGWLLSLLIGKFTGRTYQNRNPDLFVPPLAERMRKQLREASKVTSVSTEKIKQMCEVNN